MVFNEYPGNKLEKKEFPGNKLNEQQTNYN